MKVDKSKWEYILFGNVGDFFSGYTPKAKEISNDDSIPYFKVAEMNLVGNEMWLKNTELFVDDSHKVFPSNSIVFPKNGAAVSTNKKRILKNKSVVDLNTAGVTPFNCCRPLFVFYWLQTKDFNGFIRRGAVPTLNLKDLKNEFFPLPNLDVQDKIIYELSVLSSIIDGCREQIVDLDALAQSIFLDTFGDPVSNPKGWEIKPLSSYILKTENVRWENNSKSYQYIDLTSVDRYTSTIGDTLVVDAKSAPSRAKQIVKKGDVIFATTRPTQLRSTIIPISYDGSLCSTGFCVLRPSKSINAFMVFFWLHSDGFKKYLSTKESGAAYPAVSNKVIVDFGIPDPPIFLQEQFAEQVEAIERQKELLRQQLADAEILMAERMQYYFS